MVLNMGIIDTHKQKTRIGEANVYTAFHDKNKIIK
jgi:hypothetical protein